MKGDHIPSGSPGTLTYPTPATDGAKERDYWWTVLAVDPLAFPLVRVVAKKRWLTPDQVTVLSLILGLATGPLYALGTRPSMIAGAVIYYLSFVFDCVDGKLARVLAISSPRGKALDAMADGARRGSAILGLVWFLLYEVDGAPSRWAFLAAAFGIASFYFMEISGADKGDPPEGVRGKWRQMLARHRLLPTPGMPDVSAIVYFFGPITLFIVPALWIGLAMVAAGILLTWARRLTA